MGWIQRGMGALTVLTLGSVAFVFLVLTAAAIRTGVVYLSWCALAWFGFSVGEPGLWQSFGLAMVIWVCTNLFGQESNN